MCFDSPLCSRAAKSVQKCHVSHRDLLDETINESADCHLLKSVYCTCLNDTLYTTCDQATEPRT